MSRDFYLTSAEQVGPSVVRIRYSLFPLQVDPARPQDALSPAAYLLTGPGSVRVVSVDRVPDNPAAFDLLLTPAPPTGSWTVEVGDVRTWRGEELRVRTAHFAASQRFDASLGERPRSLEDELRAWSPHLLGQRWDALRGGLAAADAQIRENGRRAQAQLSAATASGEYLEARGAERGVRKPADVGLTDTAFRRLITGLSYRRCADPSLWDVLEIYYGPHGVRAHLDSGAEPFALQAGDDLSLLDGSLRVPLTWAAADTDTPGATTAKEVAACVTRQMRLAGSRGWAEVYRDREAGVKRVRVFSGTLGLGSGLSCLGGRAQLALGFPQRVPCQGAGMPTWTLALQPLVGRLRFTAAGANDLDLEQVRTGDLVLVYGAEFSAVNRGVWEVLSVEVTYPAGTKTQVFEVGNRDGAAQAGLAQVSADSLSFWRPVRARGTGPGRPDLAEVGEELRVRLPATAAHAVRRGYLQAAYLAERAPLTVSSASRAEGGLVTVTSPNHGLAANSVVEVRGARGSAAVPATVPGEHVNAPLKTDASLVSVWSTLKDPASARADHAVVALADGRALLVGGHDGTNYLDTCELLTISNQATLAGGQVQYQYAWSSAGSLPAARSRQGVLRLGYPLRSGHVLAVGGYDGASQAACYLYVPAAGGAGGWAATGSLSTARHWASASELSTGPVLAAGGYGGAALSSCELWNPTTGAWSGAASMADARYRHAAVVLQSGKVLVCGGLGAGGAPTPRCEIYDPTGNTWGRVGGMSYARYGHRALLLPDGRVLVVGGLGYLPRDGGVAASIAAAEIYDPVTGIWHPAGDLRVARGFCCAELRGQTAEVACGGAGASEYTDVGEMVWRTSRATAPNLSGAAGALLPEGLWLVQGGVEGAVVKKTARLRVVAAETTWSAGLDGFHQVAVPSANALTYSVPGRAGLVPSVVGLEVRPVGAVLNTLFGPHALDPTGLPVHKEVTTTTAALLRGHRGNLPVVDATAFPNGEGWLVLRYGEDGQVGPVRYFGRSTPTELVLDKNFVLETAVPSGARVWLLAGRAAWLPDRQSGGFWLTAAQAGARGAAAHLGEAAEAGRPPEIEYDYPGDVGLGASGHPRSGEGRLSDVVGAWG